MRGWRSGGGGGGGHITEGTSMLEWEKWEGGGYQVVSLRALQTSILEWRNSERLEKRGGGGGGGCIMYIIANNVF